nr:phosphatase PAP2 family protein [Corynebacterium lactis]
MSSKIKGDPFGESDVLVAIQGALNGVPGIIPAARAMSFFGEHALGWMGLAALGAAVDPQRRRGWVKMGAAAFTSHAASVVVKRIVRRPRPHDPRINIGVGTPSKLSFPSSHSTSTTAAMVGLTQLGFGPAPLLGIPAIMLSRLVLGVHYPTDVALGAVLGATTAVAVDKIGDKVFEPQTTGEGGRSERKAQ